MKLVIYLVAGLVVGLGSGTVWKALEVKSEVEAAMSAAADSILADSVLLAAVTDGDEDAAEEGEDDPTSDEADTHDSADPDDDTEEGAPDPAGPDQTAASEVGDDGADEESPAESEGDSPQEEEPAAAPADGDESSTALGEIGPASVDEIRMPTGAGSAVTDEGARRLARVFGAMRAADAARVLSELSDPEVEAILIKLGDRQAGQILSTFPPDRAADLSRRVLGRAGGDR